MKQAKKLVVDLLSRADILVNGDRPWDIQVKDDRFYGRVLRAGSLGFGEAYMDGWWDCGQLDELIHKILRARLDGQVKNSRFLLAYLGARLFNAQRKSKAFEIGQAHYDIGNDLYQIMLGKTLAYTCAYWKEAQTLDAAQEAKLDLVCRKLDLKKGQKILDIGCGWGSFAKFAAEKYGVEVVGITVSKEQVELGNKLCAGLPVEIRLQDYRETRGQFDHVVSLGMFEHVGCKNYREYMKVVEHCLKPNGLFLLHTIGGNTSVKRTDPWIDKYIFPNSMLPSVRQIGQAIEDLFVMEDWHSFGPYYDQTLMAWYKNFEQGWPKLKEKYGERFFRMWRFYLLSCAGNFRARHVQLWQIILSKGERADIYPSIR